MATNYNIQNGKDLELSNIYDKNLLAFNDNATFKLKLNRDTQKILNAANLLIGQSSEQAAHAEIFNDYIDNKANGHYSHVEGQGNIAFEDHQHVQGRYNNPEQKLNHYTTDRSPKIHIVGNGTSENNRSNAHFITQDGSAWYNNKVISDNYFWSRKVEEQIGDYSGSIFADNEIYVRLDEDGAHDRDYHGTDTVEKGYHKVPVVYFGEGTPDNSKGQIGDIYCMIL